MFFDYKGFANLCFFKEKVSKNLKLITFLTTFAKSIKGVP